MKKKQLIAAILLLALVFALCGCGEEDAVSTEPAGVAVQAETVMKEDVSTAHRVSGMVSDSDAASLYASIDTKIETIYVTEGQSVAAGDKLCRLSSGQLFASYNAADAVYLSTVASYFQQRSIFEKQLALYLKLWEDTKRLNAVGAASKLEIEQAELQYLGAISQRDAALAQIESGLEQYKAYQEKRTALSVDADGDVIAPFDCVVSAWGLGVDTMPAERYPIAVLSGERRMKVTTYVSEALMPLLREGDTVRVKLNAIGADVEGTIRSVGDTVNQQTRLYTVSVSLPENVPGLVAGLFADVTFFTDTALSAVAVPTEAILNYNGLEYVYIVDGVTAKYVEIRTGLVGDGVTQVTAGLSGGEQLVTVGQQYLSDGTPVRVVNAEGSVK